MAKVNVSQIAKMAMMKNPVFRNAWDAELNATKTALEGTMPLARQMDVSGTDYLRFLRVEALNAEDYPNGISNNGVYLVFEIDQAEKTVEIHSCGHIWISDIDKQRHPEFKYLAMHSMLGIAKANKVKGIRKSSYKDATDLAKKIANAWNGVMAEVVRYTGGYPYKQGVADIIG